MNIILRTEEINNSQNSWGDIHVIRNKLFPFSFFRSYLGVGHRESEDKHLVGVYGRDLAHIKQQDFHQHYSLDYNLDDVFQAQAHVAGTHNTLPHFY